MRNNSMQTLMNTQHMVAEGLPYEPPRMTTVPIRANGAMLIGSVDMQRFQMESSFNNYFQESYDDGISNDYNETITERNDWGDSFF